MDGQTDKLGKYLSPASAWAFALGTSIGWGSLVVTCSTYLAEGGIAGTLIGLGIGAAVMVVIAACYHFLMVHHPSAGGAYAYARDIFGYDHGALVAWFLLLTYLAMFWANATSLPLFARNFLGPIFQFGVSYEVLGYRVYFGEIILTMAAILLAGWLCLNFKRTASHAMVAMIIIVIVGICVCGAVSVAGHASSGYTFEPLFLPDSTPLFQIASIACISSWAFIGFESVSYSVEGFNFPVKKSFRVLTAAIVVAMLLYMTIAVLSVTVYPDGYGSWVEYIHDLSNQEGLAAIPPFYAAHHYMGDAGVLVLMAVLLCLVFTSFIGNLVALSRLIYIIALDGIIPQRFTTVTDDGVPSAAIKTVILISLFIPLLGRTIIGLIVDVTTLTATLIYGFVAACAIRGGRQRNDRVETACGHVGLLFMIVFAANILITAVTATDSMATESYLIFTLWAFLGFVVFRILLAKDDKRLFGRSVFAWIILLALILIMSAVWMSKISVGTTDTAFQQIMAYETGTADTATLAMSQEDFLAGVMKEINLTNGSGAVAIAVFCMLSFSIMLSNFRVVQLREEKSHQQATKAHEVANTDPLTGVKSKHAYVTKEVELNEKLSEHAVDAFGIVVCDVNGLKQVNDNLGHKAGDEYIRSASQLICDHFKHSPVYRIGGDEFVVVLEGPDFVQRERIMVELNEAVVANREAGKVVVACGLSEYNPLMDREVHAIFERADALMYARKIELKRPGEEVR